MKKQLPLLLLLTLCFSYSSKAQKTWLGHRVTQTSAVMDPTEIMVSGSITGLLDQNSLKEQYLPFSFGIHQSIVSKKISDTKAWEITGELGSFTQFQWTEVDGAQQRNLINTDYRINFNYNRKLSNQSTYRVRFFHVSSHIGDDFIFRNEINSFTENRVNYEQLDFTWYQKTDQYTTLYAGGGSVVRPDALRLPFSFWLGGQKEFKKDDKKWAWTVAGNFKTFQETDFNPNLKLAAGRAFFSDAKQEPFRIVVEYYRGQLPYSQYEQNKIEWLGMGLYFYL